VPATSDRGARILVVEDDASNQLTISALLEDEGFQVEVASSLAEAASRIARPPAFAAILLDRGLGKDDGLDLVPSIRSAMPKAKVIVLSGADGEVATVDATVRKGESVEVLVRCLAELLS
jgi:DNA-binding response OmpR family regulator